MTDKLEKDLRRISKNFINDQDDAWGSYLPNSLSYELRLQRISYHKLLERVENLKESCKRQKNDPELKKELSLASKEYKEFLTLLVPKLTKWKELGKHNAHEEILSNPIFKRPRTDLELAPGSPSYDEYVPGRGSTGSGGGEGESASMEPQPSSSRLPPELPPDTLEHLLQGVERENDRAILTELSESIFRYKCRDRVLKALESENNMHTQLETLKQFLLMIDQLKSSEQKSST